MVFTLLSEYLAGVSSSQDQQQFLYLGREAGLNMDRIVVSAVELCRDSERMISSLQWLSHEAEQAGDLITQTNSVVRRLLLDSKVDEAREATGHVPQSVLERENIKEETSFQ